MFSGSSVLIIAVCRDKGNADPLEDGAAGEIWVELRKSDGTITLGVEDDGAGLPEGFEPKTGGGMGLNLVRMLTEQIGGQLNFRRGKGTRFTVRFDL